MPTSTPASRLLQLLEVLETRPLVTGRELADQLAVGRRTVRRYVAALHELGIPIEGERGAGGGYRLRPGFRLPPLTFSDDEAVAVAVGLAIADRQGLASADDALAKIRRVLPDGLRRRVEALDSAVAVTLPATAAAHVAGANVLVLAEAIARRRRVHVRYRSFAGEETERELSCHGLVVHSGRWYLAAHDHLREALRTFRVDRFGDVSPRQAAAVPPPDGFDPVSHVSRSLAHVPWPWRVEVLLDLPVGEAGRRLPGTLAELDQEGERTRLRLRVSSLDWAAALLSGLGCDFAIVEPDELRSSVRALARRLRRMADEVPGRPRPGQGAGSAAGGRDPAA
jgi:predicted DNA-binding transcriptional regulator YafY